MEHGREDPAVGLVAAGYLPESGRQAPPLLRRRPALREDGLVEDPAERRWEKTVRLSQKITRP